LIRDGQHPAGAVAIRRRRSELGRQLERIVVAAAKAGEINDPRPALTAQFIPAMARAAVIWGGGELSSRELSDHVIRLLEQGVRGKRAK